MNNGETKNKNIKLQKKSSAKIAGVKSVMKTSSDTNMIAVFGRGNDAILEKRIINNEITDLNKSSKIYVDAKSEKKRYIVTSKNRKANNNASVLTGYVDKPDDSSGLDLLGLQDELEQEVFGKKFDDNIHVQIAYNIFDIVKALAPVANNITYTLNSLDRKNGHKNDVIGFVLNYSVEYEKFGMGCDPKIVNKKTDFENYIKNANDIFIYFDDIFYHEERNKYNKTVIKLNSKRDIYYSLAIVNLLRNNVSHYSDKSFILFNESYDIVTPLKNLIDKTFRNKIKTVNKNFVKSEKNNLWLIAKALNKTSNDDYKKLACELYELSVIKSNKNLGFNLKKLRESAIELGIIRLPFSVQLLNTFKQKLYKIFDFIVIHYLNNYAHEFVDRFVDALRKASDDAAKDLLYSQFAAELFNESKLKKQLIAVVNSFKSGDYKNKKNVININSQWIDSVKITDNTHDFSKLVYFISRFLDGKEINILLTSLVNKFLIIDSFNKTTEELVKMGEIKNSTYSPDYGLFADSGKVAEELKFIKSITKMTTKYENLSLESMYKEAMLTLGVPKNKLDEKYKTYFEKDSETRLSAFFKNNILESGRFKYVIKYLNPSQVSKIARNKAIVEFVLGRMPDAQIDRYYLSVINPDGVLAGKKHKISEITKLITSTDFDAFTSSELSNIDKRDKSRKNDTPVREKKKALLSLYYTIVYIFVKNLVQINSCYMLGYFYLERDKYFFGKKLSSCYNSKNFKSKNNYDTLTRLFTGIVPSDVRKLKSKDIKKLKRYIYVSSNPNQTNTFSEEYDCMYRDYRNSIDHINVISQLGEYADKIHDLDSYFDVYHFILQRVVYKSIVKQTKQGKNTVKAEKSLKYINSLIKVSDDSNDFESGENIAPYSKTLLRAINIPMGYTLPRYKNLSYEKLFVRGRENS